MPWAIFEEDGEYCVYKEDADGEKIGASLGCHENRDEAEDQLAALYATEKNIGKLLRLRKSASQQTAQTEKKSGVPERLRAKNR